MNQSESVKQEILCFLENLQSFIQNNRLSSHYTETIDILRTSLNRKLTLVVLGEVNAGKSSLINALLGEDVCPVAVLPCTDKICEITYGAEKKELLISETLTRKVLPERILENMVIIDTPGTNSTVWQHNEITASYIPNADIILAVLPAKNPYGQSIWELLSSIKDTEKKKIVFILQQCDMSNTEDLKTNVEYIENFALQKGFSMPMVLPVSAKLYRQNDKEQSGIIQLQSELERFCSLMSDAGNLLVSKMTGIEALLQKISAELEAPGKMLEVKNGLAAQLQELQTRNHNENLVILEKYTADFNSILEELERHISELCHAEARYKDLKRPSRVQEFFDLARQTCDVRVVKLAEEFVDNLSDGYNRVKKRLTDLLLDRNSVNRIGRREVYENISIPSDQFIAIAKAEAKSVTIAREPLDEIAKDCAAKSADVMSRSRKIFWLSFLVPIFIYIAVIFIFPAIASLFEAPKSNVEIVGEAANNAIAAFAAGESDGSFDFMSLLNAPIKALLFVIAVLFYVPIVAAAVRKWTVAKLEMCATEANVKVRQQRNLMFKKLYNKMLEVVDKIDVKYYAMYNNLLDEQNIIAERENPPIPSTAFDAFAQLKQEWKAIGKNFAETRE